MEQTESTAKSGHEILKPGNHPKERIKPSHHSESFQSRINGFVSTSLGFPLTTPTGSLTAQLYSLTNRH
jgi:hypothetical protein